MISVKRQNDEIEVSYIVNQQNVTLHVKPVKHDHQYDIPGVRTSTYDIPGVRTSIYDTPMVTGTMDAKGLTEVDGVDMNTFRGFPFSGIKVIGGIHLGMGLICICIGLVNMVTYVFLHESPTTFIDDNLKEKQKMATLLATSATPIWCGVWFCMCGVAALNISKKNKASIYCFKMSFLVLSILCAAIFGPVCSGVNAYEALLRQGLHEGDYKWIIPLLISFLALNEIICGFASAIVCCCCAPLKETKVRIFLANNHQTGDNRVIEQFNRSRPANPHIPREFSSDSIDVFRTNNLQKEHPPYFKTPSRRLQFTSDHLRYKNMLENV